MPSSIGPSGRPFVAATIAMMATLVLSAKAASAGPALPSAASPRTPTTDLVSPTAAFWVGVAATVLPLSAAAFTYDERQNGFSAAGKATVLAALALGPSLGYLYGRRPAYAVFSALAKGAVLGSALILDASTSYSHGKPEGEESGVTATTVVALALAAWGIADLYTLPRVVQRENARRTRMALMPMVGAPTGPAPGASVVATF